MDHADLTTGYGRTQHFGIFYGLEPYPRCNGRKLVVVGNCQAEATRLLLESTGDVVSFRIPPIFEWTEKDLPLVARAVEWADVVLSQPVRDNYRGLWGTRQISPDAVLYPVLRYDGLMPWHAIVRGEAGDPPGFPYHDLRLLADAAGWRPGTPDFRRTHEMSVKQTRQREQRYDVVTMSDVLAAKPVWHLINHPDNVTLTEMASRLAKRLGLAGHPTPPADREMLGGLRAEIEPEVAAALGKPEAAREGATAPDELHRQFYAAHPEIVEAGLRRHADRLRALGFRP